ncbi:hypothetical protein ABBQ32_014077 [Trebouxia sp. C0010 RCD-2024]
MQQASLSSSHRRCTANYNPSGKPLCISRLITAAASSAGSEAKNSRRRHSISRRTFLLQLALTAGVAGPAHAGDFILPLDATEKLPKEYEDLTRRLVTALQDAITADLDGASESEVKELNIVHGAHVTTSYR